MSSVAVNKPDKTLEQYIIRRQWKETSKNLEVFSTSHNRWCPAEILKIEKKNQFDPEELTVKYIINPKTNYTRTKKLLRYCNEIRPILTNKKHTNLEKNMPKLLDNRNYNFKTESIYSVILFGTIRKWIKPNELNVIPTQIIDLLYLFYEYPFIYLPNINENEYREEGGRDLSLEGELKKTHRKKPEINRGPWIYYNNNSFKVIDVGSKISVIQGSGRIYERTSIVLDKLFQRSRTEIKILRFMTIIHVNNKYMGKIIKWNGNANSGQLQIYGDTPLHGAQVFINGQDMIWKSWNYQQIMTGDKVEFYLKPWQQTLQAQQVMNINYDGSNYNYSRAGTTKEEEKTKTNNDKDEEEEDNDDLYNNNNNNSQTKPSLWKGDYNVPKKGTIRVGITSDLDNNYSSFYGIKVDFIEGQESSAHYTTEWIKEGELQLDSENLCSCDYGPNSKVWTRNPNSRGLLMVQMDINILRKTISFEIKIPGEKYEETSLYSRDLSKHELFDITKQKDIWRMCVDNNSINDEGPLFELRMAEYEVITYE